MSDEEVQPRPELNFLQKTVRVFAPTALTLTGFEVFLHAPLPLEVAFLVGAGLLAYNSNDIWYSLRNEAQHLQQSLPMPHRAIQSQPASTLPPVVFTPTLPVEPAGGWSKMDKLMGRHLPKMMEVATEVTQSLPVTEAVIPVTEPAIPAAPSSPPRLPPIFPAYKNDETLKLGQVVATGQRFDPHIDNLFGKGMIMAAVQGSGKSMLTGQVIEQAGKCGVPVIVLDHKGEYGGPMSELPFLHCIRAGAARLKSRVDGEFFELTLNNADEFVAMVIEKRYQGIVHLPSYGDSWMARAEIVAEVGQALMRYASKKLEADEDLVPCLVLLDEAQLYIPQNVSLLPPEAAKDTVDKLSNAFYALVSNGRSNGYTVGFATQSLTYVAKWAIKSCQIRIYGRHVEKNDLDEIAKTISSAVATREEMETLPPGHVVMFGFTPRPRIVKVDRRQAADRSSTPGIARLRQTQQVDPLDDVNILPANSSRVEVALEKLFRAGDYEGAMAFLEAARVSGYTTTGQEEEQVDSPAQDRASRMYGNSQGNDQGKERPIATAHQMVKNGGSGMGMGIRETVNQSRPSEPTEPVPAFPVAAGNVPIGPILGEGDMRFSQAQEEDFIRRYKRKSHIPTVFSEMPNKRGGIGIGKRYYHHALWIVKNRIEVQV